MAKKEKHTEKILFCGKSDMGRVRTNNEDAFVVNNIWDKKTVLAVAIDGVGGYDGGEVAADIARTKIPEYLAVSSNGERVELLKQAVTSANNAIYKVRTEGKYPSMSCVLTAAIVDVERKEINMVHVGDTRMYCYHAGSLKKLSHDHSLVGYREEIGDLTEEEAMLHPQRNVINRDVGSAMHKADDSEFIEAEVFPLLPNTILLLCSDGLTDLVTSAMICSVLEQNVSLEKKAQALIDMANNQGGKDNVTVVLVEYRGDEKDAEPVEVNEKEEVSHHVDSDVNKINPPKGKGKVILVILAGLVALSATYFIGYICGYNAVADVDVNTGVVDEVDSYGCEYDNECFWCYYWHEYPYADSCVNE